MLPEIDYPDYLPENACLWAREHRELLELVVEELLKTGTWPPLKDLTRRLAREGQPAALRSIFWEMPKPLGFVEHNPERVILTPFGLRTTHAGHKLLAGFTGVLTIAAERYVGEDSDPVITRADAAHGTVDSDPYVTALSDVVLLGAPFLGSGTGGPGEEWTREITDDVVRYFNAQSTEAYLRTRAEELANSPQLGWPPMAALPENPPAAQEPEQRDVFISHASEDKDAIARPLAAELQSRGHSVWFDDFELTLGDSLRRSIDRGLAESRFGLVILSPSFFAKQWPQRELDGLTTREIAGSTKVILPVWHEVDHAYVANFSPPLADKLAVQSTVGIPAIVAQIERALAKADIGTTAELSVSVAAPMKPHHDHGGPSRLKIPSTSQEQAKVIAERPDYWDLLLFAGVMVQGKNELTSKWHDHELRLPSRARREFDVASSSGFVSREMSWVGKRVSVVERILDPSAVEQTFGEAADPVRIEQMARGLLSMYGSLLDWAASMRNTSVPGPFVDAIEAAACMVDEPLRQIREFIDTNADQISRIPELSAGATVENPVTIAIALTLTADKAVHERFAAAMQRATREITEGG